MILCWYMIFKIDGEGWLDVDVAFSAFESTHGSVSLRFRKWDLGIEL